MSLPVYLAHGDPLLYVILLGILLLIYLVAVASLVLAIKRRPVWAVVTAIPVIVVTFMALYWSTNPEVGIEHVVLGLPLLCGVAAVLTAAVRGGGRRVVSDQ
jgi:hypothetical protein